MDCEKKTCFSTSIQEFQVVVKKLVAEHFWLRNDCLDQAWATSVPRATCGPRPFLSSLFGKYTAKFQFTLCRVNLKLCFCPTYCYLYWPAYTKFVFNVAPEPRRVAHLWFRPFGKITIILEANILRKLFYTSSSYSISSTVMFLSMQKKPSVSFSRNSAPSGRTNPSFSASS